HTPRATNTPSPTLLHAKTLTVTHPAARRLLAVVRARLEPATRVHELAQSLLTPNNGPTLKQDLWDYTLLLYRGADERNGADASATRRDEVTDWILTFQDT